MKKAKPKFKIQNLKTGSNLRYTGIIYTARDQAHKRLVETIKKKKKLPVDLKNAIIYYCGPTPAPRGKAIGSCGPTTSSRMDTFTPLLLKAGVKGMIGKGRRSKKVKEAIKKYKAIYFITHAGCGALLSRYVKGAKTVAYKNLGPEAIYKLDVENFPLTVCIDSKGRDLYGT